MSQYGALFNGGRSHIPAPPDGEDQFCERCGILLQSHGGDGRHYIALRVGTHLELVGDEYKLPIEQSERRSWWRAGQRVGSTGPGFVWELDVNSPKCPPLCEAVCDR